MVEERVQRRLAAIVAADMVGYSRLMEIDEADTLARQKAIQAELINPKVKEFGGRVVKTTGDGALIEFPSAVNAVLCSVAVQREMAGREADIPEDRRIAYRIGINLGEIIHDGDDIFGDGVNVASRLEGLAEPGGIRVSEAVLADRHHGVGLPSVERAVVPGGPRGCPAKIRMCDAFRCWCRRGVRGVRRRGGPGCDVIEEGWWRCRARWKIS